MPFQLWSTCRDEPGCSTTRRQTTNGKGVRLGTRAGRVRAVRRRGEGDMVKYRRENQDGGSCVSMTVGSVSHGDYDLEAALQLQMDIVVVELLDGPEGDPRSGKARSPGPGKTTKPKRRRRRRRYKTGWRQTLAATRRSKSGGDPMSLIAARRLHHPSWIMVHLTNHHDPEPDKTEQPRIKSNHMFIFMFFFPFIKEPGWDRPPPSPTPIMSFLHAAGRTCTCAQDNVHVTPFPMARIKQNGMGSDGASCGRHRSPSMFPFAVPPARHSTPKHAKARHDPSRTWP